jgi:hypothetical protein
LDSSRPDLEWNFLAYTFAFTLDTESLRWFAQAQYAKTPAARRVHAIDRASSHFPGSAGATNHNCGIKLRWLASFEGPDRQHSQNGVDTPISTRGSRSSSMSLSDAHCRKAPRRGCRPVCSCITTLQRTEPSISKDEAFSANSQTCFEALARLFYVFLLFARSQSRLDQEQPKEDKMRRSALLAMLLATSQSACIVVGGHSSTGGWFFWPGGLGLIVMVALLFLFLGRRRR